MMKHFLLCFSSLLLCNIAFTQPTRKNGPVPKDTIFSIREEAEFPGGSPAMEQYLKKNIHYPEIAKESGIDGKCWLEFVIQPNGEVSNITVARGVPDCPVCDKEAVRVVKAMPKWKPAKINGKGVRAYCNMPVSFILH